MKRLLLAGTLLGIPFVAHAQNVVVVSLTCVLTDVGPEVEGEIKNVSPQPLDHVYVAATFRDARGKFVSTSKDIIAAFHPILSDQTSPFDGFGGANPTIVKVTIAPFILLGPALSSSGVSSADCR